MRAATVDRTAPTSHRALDRLRVEYAKLRRLRLGPILLVGALATVLMAAMQLFSGSYRETIAAPTAQHWEGLLLWYLLVKALTTPLVVAVLASRAVEIEHLGNGWTAAALDGVRRGSLTGVKVAALAPLLVGAVVAEMLVLVLASLAAGATPPPVGVWLGTGAAVAVLTCVLLTGHAWLAARVDNQLVGLGIGVIGAFAGGFSMLMPDWLVRLIPWGWFALISPYRMDGAGYADVDPHWGWLTALLLVLCLALAAGYARLNRQEA